MSTYKVILPDSSERLFKGELRWMETGQCIIFNSEESFRKIEAVIPASALVFIVIKSKI